MIPKLRAWCTYNFDPKSTAGNMMDIASIDFLAGEIIVTPPGNPHFKMFGHFHNVPIMMSTGMTDKNGREIFEDDILKVELEAYDSGDDYTRDIQASAKTVFGVVRVSPRGGTRLLVKRIIENGPPSDSDYGRKDTKPGNRIRIRPGVDEVVGNIHQHPHLI